MKFKIGDMVTVKNSQNNHVYEVTGFEMKKYWASPLYQLKNKFGDEELVYESQLELYTPPPEPQAEPSIEVWRNEYDGEIILSGVAMLLNAPEWTLLGTLDPSVIKAGK